jgi:hypothetical protein
MGGSNSLRCSFTPCRSLRLSFTSRIASDRASATSGLPDSFSISPAKRLTSDSQRSLSTGFFFWGSSSEGMPRRSQAFFLASQVVSPRGYSFRVLYGQVPLNAIPKVDLTRGQMSLGNILSA